MKWDADQRAGGFGWSLDGQLRHRVKVDLAEALAASDEAAALVQRAEAHPNVPLFSGGLMDAWPSWGVDALEVGRDELMHIRAFNEKAVAARG